MFLCCSILLFPLLGGVLSGFGGAFFGRLGSSYLTMGCMGVSFFFSLLLYLEIGLLQMESVYFFFKFRPWIYSGLFQADWGFYFDTVTISMLLVVTSVSFVVHLYSFSYLESDPSLTRFMSYISFFTFFMLMLVSSDNLIQLFLGWEGVGLFSFLLISFWSTRVSAVKSALKAFIVNRIGDLGLTLGLLLLFYVFQAVHFEAVFPLVPYLLNKKLVFFAFKFPALDLICFLLFFGAVGKSAQIGLHIWLPDAMEGPTPVSALIHAATMVTAGVFLIVRCSFLFEYTPFILKICALMGGLTAFFAASVGLVQNDIKKVIAYSTCSQLGYMVAICGLSGYSVSLFHLTNHAFFKALLFLGAGSIIHSTQDEQSMLRLGGLARFLPFTYTCVFIGSLSLGGFPFLSGYFSKDLILELFHFTSNSQTILFVSWLLYVSAGFTTVYSIRLILLVFFGETRMPYVAWTRIHEAPRFYMVEPLVFLAFGSVFSGYLLSDIFIGAGSDFFGDSIFVLPLKQKFFEVEFLPTSVKLIPLFIAMLGGYLFRIYAKRGFRTVLLEPTAGFQILDVYRFFNSKWFFDELYNKLVVSRFLSFGLLSFKLLDKGLLEACGPTGLSRLVLFFSKKAVSLQTGSLIYYLSFLYTGCLFLLTTCFFYLTN